MKYHGMDPLKHFEFMFNAYISATGKVRTKPDHMLNIHRQPYNSHVIDYPVHTEREMSITLGEDDFKNFIDSYGKYLDLTYAIEQDQVAKDMFSKLMMYIALKR